MPTDNVLDAILSDFQGALLGYYPQLQTIGIALFGAIALLQFSYICGRAALHGSFDGVPRDLMLGILRLGAVSGVLYTAIAWGAPIVTTCQEIAAQVTGISPTSLTPSGVYQLGLNIIDQLWSARSFMMWLNLLDDLIYCVLTVLAWAAYLGAGCGYLWVLIQAVYVVIIGPILLPFAAFEATFSMLYKWFEDVLGIGIKLLAAILMLGVGQTEATDWSTNFAALGWHGINNAQIYYAFVAFAEGIVFLALVWGFPYITGRMVRTHMGGGLSWNDAGAWSLFRVASAPAQAAGAMATGASPQQLGSFVRSKLLS